MFFVEAPVAPQSCSHDMYREPCRGKLRELRLSDQGEWLAGVDVSALPLRRAGEQRSQRELGRLSPALHSRLLVSRLRLTDWQMDQQELRVETGDKATELVSIVYSTRNAALHEVIIGAKAFGGSDDRRALRREITAPHSHPELFTRDGSTGGTLAATRPQEGGVLFAMRSSDGVLLSF